MAVFVSDESNDYLCMWEKYLLKGPVNRNASPIGRESRSGESIRPLKEAENSQIRMTSECGGWAGGDTLMERIIVSAGQVTVEKDKGEEV